MTKEDTRVIDILDESALIVAHPDDENLWFSSILSKVNKIVLCYLYVEGSTEWTEGRQKSIAEYPLPNLISLGLKEGGVFDGVDWENPVSAEYGMKITQRNHSDQMYMRNYEDLKNRLYEQLQGCHNVFTHNPWGEYGHVEHVQVYRAVKSLQEEMGFTIWYSNYASNKSAKLMLQNMPEIGKRYVTLKTDKKLAGEIASIYKRNRCWTWYSNYEWSDEEVFIQDKMGVSTEEGYGDLLPINLLRIEPQQSRQPALSFRVIGAKLMRKLKLS